MRSRKVFLLNYLLIWLYTGICRFQTKIFLKMNELYFLFSVSRLTVFVRLILWNSFFSFSSLVDIGVVDLFQFTRRFILSYIFLNLEMNRRMYMITSCSVLRGMVSLVSIIPGANWVEREVWDMFGIFFTTHPDLRRIITDYCFKGYPLRKDYPLIGYTEVGYTDITKSVQYTHIELSSEFRKMRSMFGQSRWI